MNEISISKYCAQVVIRGQVKDGKCAHILIGKLDDAFAKESGLSASEYMVCEFHTFESKAEDVAKAMGIVIPEALKGAIVNTNEVVRTRTIFNNRGLEGTKFAKYRNAINGVEDVDWKKTNLRKEKDSAQNEVEVYDIIILGAPRIAEIVGTAVMPVPKHNVFRREAGKLVQQYKFSKNADGTTKKEERTSRSVDVFMFAEEFERKDELLSNAAEQIQNFIISEQE